MYLNILRMGSRHFDRQLGYFAAILKKERVPKCCGATAGEAKLGIARSATRQTYYGCAFLAPAESKSETHPPAHHY